MKRNFRKLIGAALALMCSAAGCAMQGVTPQPIEVPPPVEQKNDSLTIFIAEWQSSYQTLNTAVTMYEKQFPDVEVKVQRIFPQTWEEFDDAYTKMTAEIMSGEGPDVFLMQPDIMDMEKLARRGVLADMQPFFEADNFDWTPYNQAVMDGGVWEGKRLAIPLNYEIPVLIANKEVLTECGLSLDNLDSFQGMVEETAKLLNDPGNSRSIFRVPELLHIFPYIAGLPYADYDRQKADFSSPELETDIRWYAELIRLRRETDGVEGIAAAADVRDGIGLWMYPQVQINDFLVGYGAMKTLGETVTIPLRNAQGGLSARITNAVLVRNSSENLENAYNLIKIMLSEELLEAVMKYQHITGFSVMESMNYAYYDWEIADRDIPVIDPSSPIAGFETVDPPTPEEFEELMGYTREVNDAYFDNTAFVGLDQYLGDYISGKSSYEDAIKQAERQLAIYLSE